MSTTPAPELEIKKMKQGMSYSSKEKIIILNVFKYFRLQFPNKCVTDIVRRTAKATGCSEKSVFQFRKEESSVEGFKEPSRKKIRKNININSRHIKYDNTVRTAIRNIIYDLQLKNVVPSLNTILKHVNDDNKLPNFSLMTLRRLMCDMGFSYQKNGNKSILVEKPDNRLVNFPNEISNQNNEHKPFPILGKSFSLNQEHYTPVVNKQPNYVPMHDVRVAPAIPPMQKPMQVSVPSMPLQQHDHMMMGPPSDMMHTHSHNITMMMTPRRDVMPPPTMSNTMDMNRKREPMVPWVHGVVKQGY